MSLGYKLFQSLELKASFGYNNLYVNEISILLISTRNPTSSNQTGTSSFSNNKIQSWIAEPQISYQTSTLGGKLQLLAGGTFQQSIRDGYILNVTGYTSDALLENIQAGPNRNITSVTNNTYKYSAGFARVNYTFREKYILNVNARRDEVAGLEKIISFTIFASVGAAWIFR